MGLDSPASRPGISLVKNPDTNGLPMIHPQRLLIARQAMFSLQGDIFLKIPLDIAVNKYLGFTPMNSLESAFYYANPKYLFTGYQTGRYHPEERILPDNSHDIQLNLSDSRIVGSLTGSGGTGFLY